jgi:hypothetical protein
MEKTLLFFNSEVGKPSVKMHEGAEHIVFPVVAAKEGVMNKVYYADKVLKESEHYWNGATVTVNHPRHNDIPVSVRSPDKETEYAVGKFYNVKYDNLTLKGEIYLNKQLANNKGYSDLVKRLENGEIINVSTGLIGRTATAKGVSNNKEYDRVISDIYPDHLAILPNDIGACSVDDGCGTMKVNALSHEDLRSKLQVALGGWDSKKYIYDVYDNAKEVTRQTVYKDAITKETIINHNFSCECKGVQKIMKNTTLSLLKNLDLNLNDDDKKLLDGLTYETLIKINEKLTVNKDLIAISKDEKKVFDNLLKRQEAENVEKRKTLLTYTNSLDEQTLKDLPIELVEKLTNEFKEKAVELENNKAGDYTGKAGNVTTNNETPKYEEVGALQAIADKNKGGK